MTDEILGYHEMCVREGMALQRGMNFRTATKGSVILMSRRPGAPYRDRVLGDGVSVEYEGHDVPQPSGQDSKLLDQEASSGARLTQNGLFARAAESFRDLLLPAERVKVYEKIYSGTWSYKGVFELMDVRRESDGRRQVFVFTLRLASDQGVSENSFDIEHTRIIPSDVKQKVFKRDGGKCVVCGSAKNLHFDHDFPYSRGGSSVTVENVQILCAACNLSKGARIV